MNLIDRVVRRYADATAPSLAEYLKGYAKRHPALARMLPKVIEKSGGSGSHPEARQHGNEIWIFPKFWQHDEKLRDWIMTHELGHYTLSRKPGGFSIETAATFGVDAWDTSSLPYGQFNMDEAFADCFAAYHLERQELHRRYPAWEKIVEAAL